MARSSLPPAEAYDGPPPLPRRQVVVTMAGVMLSVFLASLDQTVVGTAMPRIIADLQGFDRYVWVTTAYLVASTSVVPVVARLTDMYGRKWFYVGGIGVFLLGSVLAGTAQTMNQLIAYRGLQGLGGGVMMANAFITVGDLFPPAERGKYQGLVSAVFALSSVIGPTLGGFITDALSWHWIFYINLPLGIPVLVGLIREFPNIRAEGRHHRLDVLGVVTLVLAVVPLLLALSWGGVQYPWGSPQVVGALVLSALMTGAFLAVEARHPEPILPLFIFRNRVVVISLLAIFITGFGMFGAIVFIPLFFQGVLGASATSSGSFLTPMMLGVVVGSALSGQALSRLGGHYRLQSLAGLAVMGLGTYFVSRMTPETTYARAVVNIVVLGFGLGVTFPAFTIAVQNAVPYRVMGVATSATQFFRSIGGTLGLAVLGSVMSNRFLDGIRRAVPPDFQGMLGEGGANPQALFNPSALEGLRSTLEGLGPQGGQALEAFLSTMRASLASAIADAFTLALGAVALAWGVTLFLKEVPLRGREAGARPAHPPAPAEGPAPRAEP